MIVLFSTELHSSNAKIFFQMLKYFFKVSDKISAKFVKNILCRKIYLFCWVQSFHRELVNELEIELGRAEGREDRFL